MEWTKGITPSKKRYITQECKRENDYDSYDQFTSTSPIKLKQLKRKARKVEKHTKLAEKYTPRWMTAQKEEKYQTYVLWEEATVAIQICVYL